MANDQIGRMLKSNTVKVGLIIGGTLAAIAGVAASVKVGGTAKQPIDARLASACEREAVKRSPGGHSDIETHSYRDADGNLGLLYGSLRSQYADDAWVPLSWVCHVRVDSGRVLKVEFEIRTSGSRLKAAAQSF